MVDKLRIETLGGLSIERGGEAVENFTSSKVEALLVYLACTGREHPRGKGPSFTRVTLSTDRRPIPFACLMTTNRTPWIKRADGIFLPVPLGASSSAG